MLTHTSSICHTVIPCSLKILSGHLIFDLVATTCVYLCVKALSYLTIQKHFGNYLTVDELISKIDISLVCIQRFMESDLSILILLKLEMICYWKIQNCYFR